MSPSWNRDPTRHRPPLAWEPPVPLHVFWAGQDDARKNTAKRLEKHSLLHLVASPRHLPKGAILLDPFAKKALSREDLAVATARGIAAIDCSWEQVEATYAGTRGGMECRALPYLVAGNPTKYGQAFHLSTAEALAASLVILGFREAAERLMSVFPWHATFFATNEEPLAAYAACATSADVVAAQAEFVPAPPEA